ncbi:MAG: PHP domain-containing protein [Solirubrobacteraceae bacterium]
MPTISQPTFDLQSHSTYSDGELTPREVVLAAHRAGVELLALTDHDTTEGVSEARAQADLLGIDLVSAVEISVLDEAGGDLHICGYKIDPANPALTTRLTAAREDRKHRIWEMAERLRALNWHIDEGQLRLRAAKSGAVGRPHLAATVTSDPRNAARLAREDLTDSTDFLVAYLIEGRPAFVKRRAPTVMEAVSLIQGAGGIATWAHPFWDLSNDAHVLATAERFKEAGIDGLEVFYPSHTRAQVELLYDYCIKASLLTTGCSDFHGPHHPVFSRFRAFCTYGLQPVLGPLA